MALSEVPVTIRVYHVADYDEVAALWTRINREWHLTICASFSSCTLRLRSTVS
jgi:hypothetical protein